VAGVAWHTYIGDNSLDDDRSNPEQPNLATNYHPGLGLVPEPVYADRQDGSWIDEVLIVAEEVSASDAELLAMRKSVQQVFDNKEEKKEEVVDEKKRKFDGSDDGSDDDNSGDSDDSDDDELPDTWTTEEGHTATRAKNYSCSGPGYVANPRRPLGPEKASAGGYGRVAVNRARAAARARSKTPVRKRPGAVTRGLGLTLMFMLTMVSPLVDGLPLPSALKINDCPVPVATAPALGACASAVGSWLLQVLGVVLALYILNSLWPKIGLSPAVGAHAI
jgi:hypothetical protein